MEWQPCTCGCQNGSLGPNNAAWNCGHCGWGVTDGINKQKCPSCDRVATNWAGCEVTFVKNEAGYYVCPIDLCSWPTMESAAKCCAFKCSECGEGWSTEATAKECCLHKCYGCGEWYENSSTARACCNEGTCGNCGCSSDVCCGDCGCCCDCSKVSINADFDYIMEQAGINRNRPLAQHAADFYLLEHMGWLESLPDARKEMKKMCDELCPEFANYIDIAVGGELRHAERFYIDVPAAVPGSSYSRTGAWQEWSLESDLSYLERGKAAVVIFDNPNWDGAYGGAKWRSIAEVQVMWAEGMFKKNPHLFLDRCWNLQHNGGVFFDKCYQNGLWELQRKVLPAHGESDYDTLLEFASEKVHYMWEHRHALRSDWMDRVGWKQPTSMVWDSYFDRAKRPAHLRSGGTFWHQRHFTSE